MLFRCWQEPRLGEREEGRERERERGGGGGRDHSALSLLAGIECC